MVWGNLSVLTKFTNWASSAWNGYDAAETKGRRYQRPINLAREDKVLRLQDRDRVISNTRAMRRNASAVAWMVRKHLDYVTTFTFRSTNANNTNNVKLKPQLQLLDDVIDAFHANWSKPKNCDVSERHSLQMLTRIMESCAINDGDAFTMKMSDGSFQIIEGDRIRNPNAFGTNEGDYTLSDLREAGINFSDGTWINGVQISYSGKPIQYALCDRIGVNAYQLRSIIPAKHVEQHGYFHDRYDATRGVSPVAAALNAFTDLYECREYALGKMKLSNLFALKMNLSGDADQAATPTTTENPNDPEFNREYKFNFGDGPQSLVLDAGDDADFLESKTPSSEFQSFYQSALAEALKALDIPYSFYNESFSTYSGSRQALVMYEQSAELKRQTLLIWLNKITHWRIKLAILDGEIVLPSGMSIDDLKWDYIAASMPWIDPMKEATAQQQLLANGTTSRQRICKENGLDYWAILEELGEEQAAMEEKGLVLITPAGTAATTAIDIDGIVAEVVNKIGGAK